jgi:hypothetical protein
MKLILVVLVTVLAHAAWGETISAKSVSNGLALKEACASHVAGESGFLAGVCLGVITTTSYIEQDNRTVCPRDANNKMTALVVMKYLENHPEQLDDWDYLIVRRALRKAYPCK